MFQFILLETIGKKYSHILKQFFIHVGTFFQIIFIFEDVAILFIAHIGILRFSFML